jgi:hypothetical protein
MENFYNIIVIFKSIAIIYGLKIEKKEETNKYQIHILERYHLLFILSNKLIRSRKNK